MSGFWGKILRVDLNTRTWSVEPLDEDAASLLIGGSGLAAYYVGRMTDAQTDPLGPENPLAFLAGPLVGTRAPSCGRYSVAARSPLTGRWGEANAGGFWGPELRLAGFDGIVVTGASDRPVYLVVQGDQVSIQDAEDLWGLDTYATQQRIRDALGDARVRVACIGPAGECLVKLAGIVNDHGRIAARTGLGAVMGSKRLKAIAVRGVHKAVPLADPDRFAATVREVLDFLKDDLSVQMSRLGGTAFYVDLATTYGDLPMRYFTLGEWEPAARLSGGVMADSILVKNAACYRCPIACGRHTRTERYAEIDGPEYETVGALGSVLLIDDLPGVAELNHLCNQMGMDTISVGVTLGLVYYLYEQGVIPAADLDGVEPVWGSVEAARMLIERMARREGIGALLAEGSLAVARAYGAEDEAAVVNGLEVPMHDPRAFVGMAVLYATSPRGACHMQGDMFMVSQGLEVPEIGVTYVDRLESSVEQVRSAVRVQEWRSIYNAAIMCQFCNPPGRYLLELLNAATGWGWDFETLREAGERIVNLKRLLNVRWGLTAQDDRLPPLLMRPLAEGGAADVVPDMELMMPAYYEMRGWDPETGVPLPETVRRLGLDRWSVFLGAL